MSALPPKSDMCGANEHVCFGPKADIREITERRKKQIEIRGQRRCASGTAELRSCLTDATYEGRSRRAVRKFAAMPVPERLRSRLWRHSDPVVPYKPPRLTSRTYSNWARPSVLST